MTFQEYIQRLETIVRMAEVEHTGHHLPNDKCPICKAIKDLRLSEAEAVEDGVAS